MSVLPWSIDSVLKIIIAYKVLCFVFAFGFYLVVRIVLFLLLFIMDFVVVFDLFVFRCVRDSSRFFVDLSHDLFWLNTWSVLDCSLTGTYALISSSFVWPGVLQQLVGGFWHRSQSNAREWQSFFWSIPRSNTMLLQSVYTWLTRKSLSAFGASIFLVSLSSFLSTRTKTKSPGLINVLVHRKRLS